MSEPAKRATASLYERDFYAWTQDQAAKLRARATFDNRGDIDWENAAEEIESVGRSEEREIENRLEVLVIHLLKWRYQSLRRSRSWRLTIREQRLRIAKQIRKNPSLHRYPASALVDDYDVIRMKAAAETRLMEERLPAYCPFTIDEILDLDFWPEAA